MSQPQWLTPAGSLGVIPEGVFYSLPIQAVANGIPVQYQLIAGELPDGVQVAPNGIIEGVPKNVVRIQGVPQEVSADTTSRFAIRAFTTRVVNGRIIVDRLADRTFTITVTGQDVPEFVTPPGRIGTFYDGDPVEIQIEFTDTDPDDTVIIRRLTGELPPGLALDPRTGLISGVISPLVGPPGTATAGYDATAYDQFPFDFSTRSASQNFQFSLEITDGKDSNVRAFEIFVFSKDSMSADTTDFTADNTFITADTVPTRTPVLLTPPGDLGTVRADNFYAFRFEAIDFDGDPIEYSITTGAGIGYDETLFDETGIGFDRGAFSLPPGLAINPDTGWFFGYIPDQGATEQSYRFAVRVFKANQPSIISDFVFFTITITGNVDAEVVWLTAPDLGTVLNGAISTLSVAAVNQGGRALQYRLASGSNSRLPQALALQPSGNITGRVSFNTFAVDGGTTTFDTDLNTRLNILKTTFDSVFAFTVNAFSAEAEQLAFGVNRIILVEPGLGGSNYNTVSVTFSAPPTGTTAQGTVTLVNGFITAINITNPGSGYSTVPTIVFSPVQSGVSAVTTVNTAGEQVIGVNIVSAGSAYAVPTIQISAPPNQINSIQATAGNITINNGVITAISVGNSGRGYITPPTVTVTPTGPGSGATAATTIVEVGQTNAVSVFRRFTVTVNRFFNEPYQTLYIKAMPPQQDRDLVAQLTQNQDIIPASVLYRADDANFGVAQNVVYDHAYGLTAASIETYVTSLDINHYWKNLTLGAIRTAQALRPDGTVLYEVVYSEIIDNLVNNSGDSVAKEVRLPFPVNAGDSTEISEVYPNSLINMRNQVIDTVGQIAPSLIPALPIWMTTKQQNGQVLGFTAAWVIAYVQPGESGRVAYNISEIFGEQLNLVDYKVDRYELDRSQTHSWLPYDDSTVGGKWILYPPAATTFDAGTTIFDGGSTEFITPADRWTGTDEFDKYLVFPSTNILD